MRSRRAQLFRMEADENPQNGGRVVRTLKDFCAHSSIVALYYIGDSRRGCIERIWWAGSLIALLAICVFSTCNLWEKWCENPVIVSSSNKPMSVGEIPFPAVTICPLTKFSTEKFNFTRAYRSIFKIDENTTGALTEEELNFVKIASEICDGYFAGDLRDNFTDIYSDRSILKTIQDLAPSFNDTMYECRFLDERKSCEKLFFPIITEEGLCYTFNSMSMNEMATDKLSSDFYRIGPNSTLSSNWDMYSGYANFGDDDESYPNRVYGTSIQSGLSVVLKVFKPDIDPLCAGGINGFKVTFHPPQETPQIWDKFFHISPGKSAIFTINPNVMITSDEVLTNLTPDERQCYKKSERNLQFFKHYTQRNCEEECLSNFTLKACGCAEFSMPRSNDTNICGPKKYQCCKDASHDIYTSGTFDECNCLPTCRLISYDAVATQGDYDLSTAWAKSKFRKIFSFDDSIFSRLVIFFKEESFIPMKRSEFHNWTSFLASLGGSFGLFLGASLFHIIELIYFFTIRIFFFPNVKKELTNEIRTTSLSY